MSVRLVHTIIEVLCGFLSYGLGKVGYELRVKDLVPYWFSGES